MALSLVYDVTIDTLGTTITVFDNTGRYDASTNTGGWDVLAATGPNDHLSDITAASVETFDAEGTSLGTINLLSYYVALETAEPTASMELVDGGWTADDGYYKFVFTITFVSATTIEVEKIFLVQTENAVNTMWLRAWNNGYCNCHSKEARAAMNAEIIYKSMEANQSDITAANTAKIVEIAEDVQDISTYRQLIP